MESATMASAFLPGRLDRIDTFLQQNYLDTGRFAGTLTLVSRRGEVGHLSALGLMDSERNKPMQEDTIFRFYSMSKPITSVALMMLYEEGHFQLSDPVSRFIPAWKDLRVWVSGGYPNFVTRPIEREMTIRDLLTHQSGLTYGVDNRSQVEMANLKLIRDTQQTDTLAGWADKLTRIPLAFSPGTRWNYSISTDICGYLVEVISGQTFDKFLGERIFKPLGMVDTAFSVPDSRLERFAACYEPTADGGRKLQDDPETSKFRKHPSLLSGGGGLVSTMADYHRFTRMLLGKGELEGTRLLGRKTVELMTRNHLKDGLTLAELALKDQVSEVSHSGIGFGLGFSIVMNPAVAQISGSPGQYGWGGAASTAFWIDPVEEVIVIFLTQLMPSSTYPVRRELQVLVNSALAD
jgi:CubicO group peptidase (beta-lactamase class C family)